MRFLGLIVLLAGYFGIAGAASPAVVELSVSGAISPGTADYIIRGLEAAEAQHAQLVVIKLDTPGGLDLSMRQIIKQIVASPVPVATFVAPTGARAASAGTYILYACHISAMAPGTNLGAATPVALGFGGEPAGDNSDGKTPEPHSTLERKQINDAAAYIRSLAQLHGRNAEWAEKAVREAVSLTAEEALKLNVIDLVARDVPDLLRQLDGRKVTVLGVERTLHTAGSTVMAWEPDWRSHLLAIITDPSLAYMLLLVGVYGLFFEFAHPGFVLPGVAGVIALLLALFAFQLLPINYAGLGLIILGIAFMVGEVFVSSFGVLGIGGIIAFVFGSVMLIDTRVPGYGIPWSVIIPVATGSALFVFFVVRLAIRARNRPIVSGHNVLIGAYGEVLEGPEQEEWATVRGENWHIRSAAPLARGQKVRVIGVDGLILDVVPTTEDAHEDTPKPIPKPRTIILPPAPYAAVIFVGWWLDRHVVPLSLNLGPATRPLAWLAIAIGLSLMLWAVLSLIRQRTTFNPYAAATRLCVTGPFRFSRNPIYLGDWFILVGLSLWFTTLWPILFSPLVWATVRYGVIRYEEEHLAARFGEEYRNYQALVRRWL